MLRNIASAPTFAAAIVASMKPRWLRHMIATPLPTPMPSASSAWASALERSWTSRKVSVPASSMIATSSAKRASEAV